MPIVPPSLGIVVVVVVDWKRFYEVHWEEYRELYKDPKIIAMNHR
jgi:hypothetical protein